jgi:hypothetical protein
MPAEEILEDVECVLRQQGVTVEEKQEFAVGGRCTLIASGGKPMIAVIAPPSNGWEVPS